MKFKLPAERVQIACAACIADLKKGREEIKTVLIVVAMSKKGLHFDGWKIVWRQRTKAEAIRSISYPGSEYRLANGKWWKQEEAAEELHDACIAVMKDGEKCGTSCVTLTSSEFSYIESYYNDAG